MTATQIRHLEDLERFRDDPAAVYIDGKWFIGEGDPMHGVNPATEEPLPIIRGASKVQVNEAVSAARRAQYGWARTRAFERAAALRKVAQVLRSNSSRLASLLVLEVGKPYQQALEEVEFGARYAEYMSEWANRIEGNIVPSDNVNEAIHLMRVPVGVIAAITAWNFPLGLYVRKLIPALTAGNTIVVKPTEVTPLISIVLTRLLDEHLDLPEGVLNLVSGDKEVGRTLVQDPGVNLISMTGHRDTGKRIMGDAAQHLTRVLLELGGKAPAIVLADADLELAVSELLRARVAATGQDCSAAERLYVEAPIYDDFVHRYVEAAAKLTIGDPWGDVDLGPLVSETQHRKATAAVGKAQAQGASIAIGGGRPAGAEFERGFWFAPTVLTGLDRNADIMREEVFAPVIPVVRVGSIDEALELANDSRYGLSAYLFTSSYATAMRAVGEIDFGELYINRTVGESMVAFHGGWRESGVGGEDGKFGVEAYTQIKAVYHRYGR